MRFPAQTWLPSFTRENVFRLRTASCLSISLVPSHNITSMKSSQTRRILRQNIQTHNIHAKSRKFTIRWTIACRCGTPKRSCTAIATQFGTYLTNSYKTKSRQESIYQQRFTVAYLRTNSASKCSAHSCSTITAATMLCCGNQCC